MKTRYGSDYSARGVFVGALSAASIALLGLSLAQQSPTKLATADSPLSSSARTALKGTGHGEVAESGSSDHGSMEMVVVTPDFSDCFENQAFEDAKRNVRVACVRHFATRLGKGVLSQGQPPVNIDDDTRGRLQRRLSQVNLTDEENAMAFDTKDFNDWSSFNFHDSESQPMTEDEVVESKGGDESDYENIVKTLCADLAYITQRKLTTEGQSDNFWVDRPKTMFALFRSNPFTRFMVFTLPYMIDNIAAHSVYDAFNYGFDIVKALPELQKGSPASISFSYVSAFKDKLDYAEVKHDEEIVVKRDEQLVTESSHVSNAEELSQVIKRLKMQAKIPDYHELVIAFVVLLDPTTKAETTVLCSDVGVFESLQNQAEHLDRDSNFGSNSKIMCVDATFVDCKRSHLMKNHIVGVFGLLEKYRLLNNNLIDQSASLLDEMKKGLEAIADN